MATKSAAQRFADWLDQHGVGPTEAARALGVSRAAIQGFRSGEFRPNPVSRSRIEVFTNGEIPASLWMSEKERREIETTPRWEPIAKAGS
jgi:predicted transcriptional regulator